VPEKFPECFRRNIFLIEIRWNFLSQAVYGFQLCRVIAEYELRLFQEILHGFENKRLPMPGCESQPRRVRGLPDGIFSYQKFQFGYILEGLGMENVGVTYGYFWNILLPFGIFYGSWVYFVII
jgi:hypothetical protein